MNYAAHYDRLIDRARGRVLEGYRERHHVLPRCLGGGDEPENIVDLTAEEHYTAHQLLVRLHPNNGRLVHAAVWMARRCNGNKAYGWLRRRHAAAVSKTMKGNKSWLGKKHTADWKAERSAAQTGVKMSPAGVEKMAASKRGKHLTAEHRAKISAGSLGLKRSPETRARIAASKRGKPLSAEHGRKVGEANRGRAKIAAAHRARFQQVA